MTLSKYCKIYPSGKTSRNVILYSTKNAAIGEMPRAMAANISDGTRSKEDRETLRKMGFLINDFLKERKQILGFIDDLNEINKTLNIKLVMNLDCNLACRYCFEGTRKGKFYMTKQTADDFISFVKKTVHKKMGFKELLITFYGGEPLLSRELIVYISQKLKLFQKNRRFALRHTL